jgi:DNA invertase Pin-like site-specific DNA recombinase
MVMDSGLSGATMKERKEFMAMKQRLKRGDTIIANSLSRIGRSVKELSTFVSEMEQLGVRIIDRDLDLSTPKGLHF